MLMTYIADSHSVPDKNSTVVPSKRKAFQVAGVVSASVGLFLALFFATAEWVSHDHVFFVAAAAGLVPLLIGGSFLVFARLHANERRHL
jgi:hypothetical protein